MQVHVPQQTSNTTVDTERCGKRYKDREYLYILESADDAIEFFGGTGECNQSLAVNPDDDMFDFTQGYSGKLKNCYGVWENGYTSTEADPRGIEADGNMDGLYPDHLRQSDFKVENMTIVNNAANTMDNVDRMQDVIKIRRGAKSYDHQCICQRFRRYNRFD